MGYRVKKRKKTREKKDLYRLVKCTEKKEKKEYTTFYERLTDSLSLTGDVAGEMMLYLAGSHCMVVRNFLSVTEYTANKIRLKTKQYELCVEGTCLRMEYFLPEEIRVVGDITGVSYHKARG